MKAIIYEAYGAPDVLQLRDIERPAVTDNGVLVRVRAVSVNPADWHLMRGKPYFMRMIFGLLRPRRTGLGADLAGQVEAVGRNVTRFRPHDEVFGQLPLSAIASFGEYVCAPEDALVVKPANLTFEQAAAVPLAGLTALQGLRREGGIQSGQKVLINGASGGVGTFAVQLAKAFGAEVTGVCSTRNVDRVRSIGADHVIDYTQQDFTRGGQRYDLILDIAGSRSLSELRRVLLPNGTSVVVGGPEGGPWFGPMIHIFVKMLLLSRFVSQKVVLVNANVEQEDLRILKDLLEAGNLTPVIDRHYKTLSDVPEAIRYLEEGHARGKVVVSV
jgi:NADPH:quinone reductase-like Zn-dependent oxidoreductase